jgi:hypothetical protein
MKIKKPTKKILIILGIALFILIATSLYYFLFIRKGQEEKWYDSNWSYRRSIYIKDIPREFQRTQQDVLVQIDTKTLISEEKLVNDCRDIRFVDEDNNTTLKYWIEGGCNTDETEVWVNLELPRASEKIIYMYYGNKLAVDNQEDWDGEFISMNTKDCDSNWIPTNEFAGRFVMADSEFGITGGSASHTHRLFEYSEINCDDPVFVANDESLTTKCDTDQDNILNLFTTPVSNIPPYENVNFCTSRNGYLSSSSIILFDKNTPDGWDHVSSLDNKFARGNDGTSPDTSGTHIHYASCINKDLSLNSGNEKYLTVNDISRTTVKQDNLPYYTINYISNANGGKIPKGSIMMTSSIPPLGWETYNNADGKLLKGGNKEFGLIENSEKHSHIPNMEISLRNTNSNQLSDIGTEKVCLFNYLNQEESTSEESILAPYITVLLARKKDSLMTLLSVEIGSEEKGEVLGTVGSAPSQPTELKTEGQINPINVTDTTPEFTAKFNHPDYP